MYFTRFSVFAFHFHAKESGKICCLLLLLTDYCPEKGVIVSICQCYMLFAVASNCSCFIILIDRKDKTIVE